jgi:uncharacterized protein (TIGR02453 family)
MKYFTPDFFQFYKDLAANNNRDYFQSQKKRYEESVKGPMEIFVGDMIKVIAKHDKKINVTPSECIFRINRDIRFSKDKTPYKLYSSAAVSAGGKKSMTDPGIYVELGPEALRMGGGIYMPEKELILSVREAMTKKPKEFMKLLAAPDFKKKWGELQGEKNKIIPAEMREAAEVCPYIYNKQFFYWTELPAKHITSDKLLEVIMEHYTAALPIAKWLEKAGNN